MTASVFQIIEKSRTYIFEKIGKIAYLHFWGYRTGAKKAKHRGHTPGDTETVAIL